MKGMAEEISGSGFGTVILGQWHVQSDGTLHYNDTPSDAATPALQEIVPIFKASGMTVLLNFGPLGTDFTNMMNNEEAFKDAVAGIQANIGIDGLDWDPEPQPPPKDSDYYTPALETLLVELTAWATGLGMIVTAAPFMNPSENPDFWKNVFQQTNTKQSTGFSWWNLQVADRGDYPAWVGYLSPLFPGPNQKEQAQAFLVPKYDIGNGSPPTVTLEGLKALLTGLKKKNRGLFGASLWKYENISPNTVAQVAQAIAAGVSSTSLE
jgi:chitinase